MLRGKVNDISILTLEKDLEISKKFGLFESEENKIKQKHELANLNNRYVVRIKVILNDDLDDEFYSIVQVFLPKSIFNNHLIEKDSLICYDDKLCYFNVAGVEDFFDRAILGNKNISDILLKQTNTEK